MPKVFGMAGYSGAGKTTLIEEIIPRLIHEGVRVSVIKHAHHEFDIDKPGKDSYRHREAGAHEVLISANKRWVLMHELNGEAEPSLEEQIKHLSPCDLIIVEGYKRSNIPKIEVWRQANGKPLLYPQDENIVAIASDPKIESGSLPALDLNDPDAITEFILNTFLND